MVSPVRGDHRRFQAETPLIDLFKFAEPALTSRCGVRADKNHQRRQKTLNEDAATGLFGMSPEESVANTQPPACIIMPLGVLLSFFLGWHFIALYRRLANTGPLEDFERLWNNPHEKLAR
jgi:hypothetical protein